jgi:hypothetical protein
MRFKHVNVRVLLSSLLAVLALSAVVASAAQASTESPFFKVAGSRLGSGVSKEVKVTQVGNYVMSQGSTVITCTKMSSAAGAKIIGSAAGKAGTLEGAFTFSGCTQSGQSSECKITEVKTEPLVGTLVLNEGKSYIEALLKPKSKKHFATITETGGCVLLSSEINGQLVMHLKGGKEGLEYIHVGSEAAEAHSLTLAGPGVDPGSVWEESKITEVEPLEDLGATVTVSGESTVELANKELWGVFT